jgi:uncharacterized membrane protein
MEGQAETVSRFNETIELVGKAVDAAGVFVIVAGVVVATVFFLINTQRRENPNDTFRRYRQGLGRALLLGLEVLVAADIIRTVAITPTFQSVGILALIVVIRTFLSWSLEVELEGRWPWQARVEQLQQAPGALGTAEREVGGRNT